VNEKRSAMLYLCTLAFVLKQTKALPNEAMMKGPTTIHQELGNHPTLSYSKADNPFDA